jgi:hypothetical protein
LAEGRECGLKQIMGGANVTHIVLPRNCGPACPCMTADVHLTHMPCEEGCYKCGASVIEYHL